MSSIRRPLSGDVLVFRLGDEIAVTRDPEILERSGRIARTLFKQQSLRATVVVLGAGGELEEHSAPGPITVQPLDGLLRFIAGGETHELAPGDLLTAAARVRHSVTSEDGATFLLTVSLPGDSSNG